MFSWSKVIVKCGDQYEMDLRNNLLFYLNEWESNRFIMNISETFNRGATWDALLNFFIFCSFDILNRMIVINWCTIKDQLKSPLEAVRLTK